MEYKFITHAEAARVMKQMLGPEGAGWCKGLYENPLTGQRCLIGAWLRVPYKLFAAIMLRQNNPETLAKLAGIIREQFPERVSQVTGSHPELYIMYFNDHEDTCFADVLAILEKLETAE